MECNSDFLCIFAQNLRTLKFQLGYIDYETNKDCRFHK